MLDYKELYILGKDIDTKYGKIKFIKVKEYDLFIKFRRLLTLTKDDIIEQFIEMYKMTKYENDKIYIKQLSEYVNEIENLFDIISSIDFYKEEYVKMFDYMFEEDGVFEKIESQNEFIEIINTMCYMNCVSRVEKNSNSEIEKFNEYERMVARSKVGSDISIESMITSVWMFDNDILNLTLYQLNALFNRISRFKGYDTSMMFRTVSSDIQVVNWFEHVDMFNSENNDKTLEEFSKIANSAIT